MVVEVDVAFGMDIDELRIASDTKGVLR